MNIASLLKVCPKGAPAVRECLLIEISSVKQDATKAGKPYLTVEIADCSGHEKIKVWSDNPAFSWLAGQKEPTPAHLVALFSTNEFGLNADRAEFHNELTPDQIEELYSGDEEFAERNDRDWKTISEAIDGMQDDDLRDCVNAIICGVMTEFRRAAAAFGNHHARRGGLLEHTAQMLRCAQALAPMYPEVCWDLLFAGVILHDIGKVVETGYPERGFGAVRTVEGELLGHIGIGVRIIAHYWTLHGRGSSLAIEHLLHLILSHHGQNEWGSPVTPKTPEAILLHQIDMIDSRMEMWRMARKAAPADAEVLEGRRGNFVRAYKDFPTE